MSPRGGRRSGRQGVQYPNRSDLQQGARPLPVSTAKGQPYGVAGEQEELQRALPLRRQPPPVVTPPTSSTGASPPPPTSRPLAEIVPLDAPTARPTEPLTAGVDIGPGPGAPPSSLRPSDNPVLAEIRALYMQFPYPGIRELIEDFDGE